VSVIPPRFRELLSDDLDRRGKRHRGQRSEHARQRSEQRHRDDDEESGGSDSGLDHKRAGRDAVPVTASLLFISGLWGAVIVIGIVGLLAIGGYAIWTLRSDEGWEERVPPPKDEG
jgi:hypothetical protein